MSDLFFLLENNFILSILIVLFFSLCFGSFLNVVIYRLPLIMDYEIAQLVDDIAEDSGEEVKNVLKKNKNISLSYPASHCPSCKKNIPLYLNIPILGYLISKGKCFNCGEHYSFRYLFIEIFIAFIWCIFFIKYNFSLDFFFYSFLFSFLTVSAIIDYKYQILPDRITFPLLFTTYLFFANHDNGIFISESLNSGILIFVILYLFVKFYEKIRGIETAMGEGDLKLYLLSGSIVGFNLLIPLVLLSIFLGIINFIFIFIFNKNKYKKDIIIPFGPSIILSLFFMVYFKDFFNSLFYFI